MEKPKLTKLGAPFKYSLEEFVNVGDWVVKKFKNDSEMRNFRQAAKNRGKVLSIRRTAGDKNEYLVELKKVNE